MTLNKKVITSISIFILVFLSFAGCIDQQNGNKIGLIIIPATSALGSGNPKYVLSSYYSSNEIKINSSISQYELPLDLSLIENYDDINNLFDLDDEQNSLIISNGFVVRDYGSNDDIIQPYKSMKQDNIPIFITSDTLLHLYHIQFDETLKSIEEREFFDGILDLSKSLFDYFITIYDSDSTSNLNEAIRRNIAFFAVGLSLLQTPTEDYDGSEDIEKLEFIIPDYIYDEVESEIDLINAHSGFSKSPIFKYEKDYSQYIPRGHYTRSEKLKRYFKAMMWYGRISFLLRGSNIINEYDAEIATIQASLISTALPTTVNSDELTVEDIWNRIYSVTSFFVGTSDDLTPFEYLDRIKSVFGLEFNASEFENVTKMLDLKVELAKLRNPQIFGGSGNIMIYPPYSIEKLYEVLDKTKGMRLMGQRFIPDSYMFQMLVFPAVQSFNGDIDDLQSTFSGNLRVFPQGLDVMSVLGSQRAKNILDEGHDSQYEGYEEQLELLSSNFSNLNLSEWNRNLYFSWIYTLKSLLKEYDTNYPTFMQTSSWQDKQLHTALASWAELRHDTILYAKQSYTPRATSIEPEEKPVVGYVEPVPEFYSRILALTSMTKNGLNDMNVLTETEINRLQSLETVLQRLISISINELENKELTDNDYEFIRNFGENIDNIITGVNDEGKETTIIADVHTDSNSGLVLEEGVGYVDLILVAYKVPDGRIIMGAGPVFSYYEFKHPMNDRLTDEQWKDMLQSGATPDRPSWVSSFISE